MCAYEFCSNFYPIWWVKSVYQVTVVKWFFNPTLRVTLKANARVSACDRK